MAFQAGEVAGVRVGVCEGVEPGGEEVVYLRDRGRCSDEGEGDQKRGYELQAGPVGELYCEDQEADDEADPDWGGTCD